MGERDSSVIKKTAMQSVSPEQRYIKMSLNELSQNRRPVLTATLITAPARQVSKNETELIKLLGRFTSRYTRIPAIITALVIPIGPGTVPMAALMMSTAVIAGGFSCASRCATDVPATKLSEPKTAAEASEFTVG